MPTAARNIVRRPGVRQGIAPDAVPHSGPFDDEGRPITTQQTNLDNQIQAGDHCSRRFPSWALTVWLCKLQALLLDGSICETQGSSLTTFLRGETVCGNGHFS